MQVKSYGSRENTSKVIARSSVKSGDLVRFKVHHYNKSYGLGVLLELKPSVFADKRHWALFNSERMVVRLNELELVSESR